MTRGTRSLALVLFAGLAAGVVLGFAPDGSTKEKPKAPAAGKPSGTPAEPINACGCYKDTRGACVCTDKKAKCECPGECDPVGCSEKREKELEREMAAEVKRAQEDEKRRKAQEEAAERGENASPDAGAAAESPPSEPEKKAPKGASKPGAKTPKK